MSVLSFLKEVAEEDDRVTIRSSAGLNLWSVVLLFTGLIVAALCLSIAYIASGRTQTELVIAGSIALAAAGLGLMYRIIGPKKWVDFRVQTVAGGGVPRSFSDLAFVAITERTRIVRTEHNNMRVPHFDMTLGFGEIDPGHMSSKLAELRAIDPGDEFIAGESVLDEQAIDDLFVGTRLKPFALFESSDYPTLFRTAHRLAKDAGVPLVNLTGTSFSVASGAELELPFGQRTAMHRHEQEEEVSSVDAAMKPEGFEISWDYPLGLAVIIALVLGIGSMCFGILLGTQDASNDAMPIIVMFALLIGVPTLIIVAWLLRLSGRHRVLIDGSTIGYARPFGAEEKLALDDLIDVYLRPNLSNGMSVLMLISELEVVVVRGRLPDLRGVDLAIRSHFQSPSIKASL